MTSAPSSAGGVPSFLLDILAREMAEAQGRLLRRVAEAYGHDPEEMLARFLPAKPPTARVVPESVARVRVVKEPGLAARGVRVPAPEDRCLARTWNRGNGGQCTRRRAGGPGSDYCPQHQAAAARGALRHGRIDQSRPAGLFPDPDHRDIHTIHVLSAAPAATGKASLRAQAPAAAEGLRAIHSPAKTESPKSSGAPTESGKEPRAGSGVGPSPPR